MKEYKVIDIKKEKTNENLEKLMNTMAKDGWDVISIQQDPLSSLNIQFVVTFSRNIDED